MNLSNPIRFHTLLLLTAISLTGCGGGGSGGSGSAPADTSQNPATTPSTPVTTPDPADNLSLDAPADFDYDMNQDVTLRIQVLDHNGNPGKHIAVTISEPLTFALSPVEDPVPQPAPLSSVVSRGQTNAQGYFEQTIRLPGHLDKVRVQVSQLGIENVAVLDINSATVFHEFK